VTSHVPLSDRSHPENHLVESPGCPDSSLEVAPADSLARTLARIEAIDRLIREQGESTSPNTRQFAAGEGPVVDLVDHLVHHAFTSRSSDLHLEPCQSATRVRLRIDGDMTDAAELPMSLHGAIVNRIKVLAGLDIVEHRRPQDGQFSTEIEGVGLDVRVATLPAMFGEKVVLRLLDTRRAVLRLTELGMDAADAETCRHLIRAPFGLVLCCGPTGAGKTTTLYASLLEVDARRLNVTTIEDPVEYVMPAITQVSVNDKAGVSFATGLRALLRQDPDVILVGEIRDAETAHIAVQAALTGHLVLSSLHGTDAVGALYRLLDMGIDRFLVASAVVGVVGQRLVRRICASCRTRFDPAMHELGFFAQHGGDTATTAFFTGTGCDRCAGTGFHGRIGVYELLPINSSTRESLISLQSVDSARRRSIDEGLGTMLTAGVRLVEAGTTTVGEITRLLEHV
jgi:type IV pilus assembly protein PilB